MDILNVFRVTPGSYLVAMALTLLCVALLPSGLLHIRRPRQRKRKTFPLMELPSEVRLIIFEHLIEDEQNPAETIKTTKLSDYYSVPSLGKMIRTLFPVAECSLLSSLTLVNRQIHDEFLQVCCQKAMFNFTLDASHTNNDSFWKVTPSIIRRMHNCTLKVLATPGIVGAFDPRQVSGNWELQDQVFSRMAKMLRLTDLRLSIEACGNQLWNPIWLWHYTSQSFKESTNTAFNRISFDLQGWNLREPNHLARQGQAWEWRCSKDHFVLEDPQGNQPIRDFAGALYEQCPICDPPKVQ